MKQVNVNACDRDGPGAMNQRAGRCPTAKSATKSKANNVLGADRRIGAKKLIFYKGEPLGAGREDHLDIWDRTAASMEFKKFSDLNNLYAYALLRRVFDWVSSFRAGIVMIYREPRPIGARELLLVHQRETRYSDNGVLRTIPERRGPPKGGAKSSDKTALMTAIREAKEETGIDILDPKFGAKLMPSVFLARRPEENVEELIIYFVAVFEAKPPVVPCDRELTGYSWVDMTRGLRYIRDVARPTEILFNALDNINMPKLYSAQAVELPDVASQPV